MRERSAETISRRALVRTGLYLGAGTLLGLSPACRRPPPEPLVKAGMYGDTPEELQRLWFNILAACHSDDRNRVHDLMVSLIMTQPELASLIGPQKAAELWARYQAMMGSLCNAGAVELVAHIYEKKYDDVAVARIDTLIAVAPDGGAVPTGAAPAGAAASGLLDTDVAVQKALLRPTPFYTVRIKKKSEAKGLRYDFFVYRNGFWRSGNLLGKFLLPPPALPAAGAPLANPPAGAPAKSPPDLSSRQ